MRRLFSAFSVALAGLLLAIVPSTPAFAHSTGGSQPTTQETELISIEPQIPGVTIRVVSYGAKLELENLGSADVFIPGYQGEPYLKVGPSGAFENRLAPTKYVNQTRSGTSAIPSFASVDAAPEWVQIRTEPWIQWHDHRAHIMSSAEYSSMANMPGMDHTNIAGQGSLTTGERVIQDFTVDVSSGTTASTIAGIVVEPTKPSALPWIGLSLALIVGLSALGIALKRLRRWLVMAIIVTVVGFDMLHAIGAAAWSADQLRVSVLSRLFSEGFYLIPGWIVGGIGVASLIRRRNDGYYAALFTSACIALFGGLLDILTFYRPLLPNDVSPGLVRLSVALSIGVGIAGVIVSAAAIVKDPERRRITEIWLDENDDAAHSDPQPEATGDETSFANI